MVPTKDRHDDLQKLLVSLTAQTVQPTQIVIVDGGDTPIKALVDDYPGLPITYVREYPPSLARQRNAGMAALQADITVAGYLDDDLELEPDATARMRAFWEKAGDEVGGAAFTIKNQPLRHGLFGKVADLFLINGGEQGRVLASGFATSITPQSQDMRTDWLYGGATLWRRSVIRAFQYDEWYIGHGFLEDLDFSYRVSRSTQLWVVADAKVWHWPHPIRIERNVSLGRQQVVNRVYFVRKLGGFKRLPVIWALFGQCVRNGLESLKGCNRAGALRLWGNLLGLRDLLVHGTRSVEGIWK
ncbi:glycosyltransferase [Devosia sp. UYZn731]|uniref:glycosyltransferase family 2 protein n=1 Tax=Devosia sp. UYZn731 TaxID=3156345 RepID=UPI0033914742